MAMSFLSALKVIKDFNSNPSAKLQLFEKGLLPRTKPVDLKLVERLLVSYHKAKVAQKGISSVYDASGEWDIRINKYRSNYLKVLEDKNVAELANMLENFFRNECVVGLLNYPYALNTSTLGKKEFINIILKDLETWKSLVGANIKSLDIPPIGNPYGYVVDDTLVTACSLRHHYNAIQVKNLLTGIKNPVVVEIGGGYGGFAYYLLKSGDYKYIDFDLPEILLIAEYYLMAVFPEKKALLFGEGEGFDQYDMIFMPHFQLPKISSNSVDLFINIRSMSEMNYDTIKEYVSQIARACRMYFYHENSEKDVLKEGVRREVVASKFPIPDNFKRVYKCKSPWQPGRGRIWEFLYQKI